MLTLGRVTVHPGFWGMLVLAKLIGAGEVLPLAALAALCHEMGHLAALRLAGATVEGISFTGVGVEIRADTRYLPYGKDILCTIAGPAVNLALALILSRVSGDYLFAGANLLQGLFNLLPVPGLDGARALYLLLSWILDPMRADTLCHIVAVCIAAGLCMTALYLVLFCHSGIFLLIAALGVLKNALREECGK